MRKKGFTLIELLVVIAIIGILASAILIGLSNARGDAKQKSAYSSLRSVQGALSTCITIDSMEEYCYGSEGSLNSSSKCGGGSYAIPVAGTAICGNSASRSSTVWPDISDTGYSYGAYAYSGVDEGAFAVTIYKSGDNNTFCCTQDGCQEVTDTRSVKGYNCRSLAGFP